MTAESYCRSNGFSRIVAAAWRPVIDESCIELRIRPFHFAGLPCLLRVDGESNQRKVEKQAMIDALEGLMVKSSTGPVTIGKNHHATMNMFLAKTKGRDLVTVRALGAIAPEPRCQ